MNYRSLVPLYRAACVSGAACLNCGHVFKNERDVELEHIEPARHDRDWARLHARNLRISCGSCNRTKAQKPFVRWLDEQEEARLSNLLEAKTGTTTITLQPTFSFMNEAESE